MNKIQGSIDLETSAPAGGLVGQEDCKVGETFSADGILTGAPSAGPGAQSLLSRSRSPEHNVRRSLFRR